MEEYPKFNIVGEEWSYNPLELPIGKKEIITKTVTSQT